MKNCLCSHLYLQLKNMPIYIKKIPRFANLLMEKPGN